MARTKEVGEMLAACGVAFVADDEASKSGNKSDDLAFNAGFRSSRKAGEGVSGACFRLAKEAGGEVDVKGVY